MSNKINNLIQDLTVFFIKENYKKYLQENHLEIIEDNDLHKIIEEIYSTKKIILKNFIKNSLKEILKKDYIGDLVLENIFIEMFNDELLCKNRLILEIKLYQQKSTKKSIDYDKILS